jgi:hypothetical protein
MKTNPGRLTRRRILQLLAAAGITGPAAVEIAAQAGRQISPDILKSANLLLDQSFDDERLRLIAAALQRNLEQFRAVRDLVIDDMVEPAPVFAAKS